ncbi:hypothetical protein [Burkholderia anthina]|uniref:hypothetical protein n=1 Tax=Burkholderia anthina TaxID=179879 RepID=UPI0007C82867|nr:hypothetical protein [Burkholderia anthina]
MTTNTYGGYTVDQLREFIRHHYDPEHGGDNIDELTNDSSASVKIVRDLLDAIEPQQDGDLLRPIARWVYNAVRVNLDLLHGVCGEFGCPQGEDVATWLRARLTQALAPFQQRVQPWMLACFGAKISADKLERNHRFFEEAGELVQACGMTREEAHALVDYTWSRPVGEPTQEVGGVMVTLAALCLANGLDMHASGETELARINVPETVAKIRAKQAAKPKHSPLPEAPRPPAMTAGAPEELPHWFEMFLTNVCEISDRNSPDGEPDAIVATLEELRNCALNAIEQCISYAAPARSAENVRAWETDDGRVITDLQKQQALHDGGASDSSVQPYAHALYRRVPAHATAPAIFQILTEEGAWLDTTREYYDRTKSDPALARVVYSAPQATAQAVGRAGLTDEQRAVMQDAVRSISLRADELKESNTALDGTWCDADEKAAYEAEVRLIERLHALLAAHPGQPEPIDMLLYCPKCGVQHIDHAEPAVEHEHGAVEFEAWDNPPHRSHLCHACGTIWRPADVPTNGVAAIRTRGKADTWSGKPEPRASAGVIAAARAVIEADRAQTLTTDHVDALDNAIKIQRGELTLPEPRAEVTDDKECAGESHE